MLHEIYIANLFADMTHFIFYRLVLNYSTFEYYTLYLRKLTGNNAIIFILF